MAGLALTMADDWHTYWINPGAAGIATDVEWTLPKGVSAGPIQWPTPEKFTALGSIGYGYHDKTILLVPLTIAADAALGQATISGKVSWLECKESCIPRDQQVSATLTIAGTDTPSANAAKLDAAKTELPKTDANLAVKAWWDGAAKEDERTLLIEFDAGQSGTDADFFALLFESFEVSPESEVTASGAAKVRIKKTVMKFEGAWPSELAGLAVRNLKDHGKTEAYEGQVPDLGFRIGRGRNDHNTSPAARHRRQVALADAVVRLHRRSDFERHAVCAAGDLAENSRLCQPKQGVAGARAAARDALRRGGGRFVLGAGRRGGRREKRGRTGKLGHADVQPAVRRFADGSHHAGGVESVRAVRGDAGFGGRCGRLGGERGRARVARFSTGCWRRFWRRPARRRSSRRRLALPSRKPQP